MSNTIRLHRVIKAPAERIYKAFLNSDALAKWLPPHGFTANIERLDARVGGTYKMSFTNFSTGSGHAFGGEYLELVPNKKLRYTDKFDAPDLSGTMITTVELNSVSCGTDFKVQD